MILQTASWNKVLMFTASSKIHLQYVFNSHCLSKTALRKIFWFLKFFRNGCYETIKFILHLVYIRMQLAMKDAEIQRLQSCLQSQEASSQTMLIESLRQELTSMLENKHQGGCSTINISIQTRISTCIDYFVY